MKSLILYHHLGLGDHFVCNGLVNFVSNQYDKIYLPCKERNYPTVNYLYSENKKVSVFKITKDEFKEVEAFSTLINAPVLQIGFGNVDPNCWDESFYNQLNIDFQERYNSFSLPLNPPEVLIPVPDNKYILIHNEASIGKYELNIDTEYERVYIESGVTDNLFSYIELIRNAEEIHCINSSVFHLIDSINNLKSRLYYHDIREYDGSKFEVSQKWQIVKYL